MLLGLVLSGLGAHPHRAVRRASRSSSGGGTTGSLVMLLPILLPISILVVPLADLVLAVVRRTRRGQAFYQPDKEHLHHRLLEIGHSQRRAVLIMWLWAGLIAFGAVLISLYSGPLTWAVLAPAGPSLTVRADLPAAAGAAARASRASRTISSADRTPVSTLPGLCANFHKTAARRRSDEAANDDDPHLETPRAPRAPTCGSVGGCHRRPERCDSFARSGSGTARGQRPDCLGRCSSAPRMRSLQESEPAGWAMSVPTTRCGDATRWSRGAPGRRGRRWHGHRPRRRRPGRHLAGRRPGRHRGRRRGRGSRLLAPRPFGPARLRYSHDAPRRPAPPTRPRREAEVSTDAGAVSPLAPGEKPSFGRVLRDQRKVHARRRSAWSSPTSGS